MTWKATLTRSPWAMAEDEVPYSGGHPDTVIATHHSVSEKFLIQYWGRTRHVAFWLRLAVMRNVCTDSAVGPPTDSAVNNLIKRGLTT